MNLKKFLKKANLYYFLDFIRKLRFFQNRFHHQYFDYKFKKGVTKNAKTLDSNLLLELTNSLKNEFNLIPSSQWKDIHKEFQSDLLPLIENSNYEEIGEMLINPTSNNLMYGFDNMAKDLQSRFRIETRFECQTTADYFLVLSEFLEQEKVVGPEGIVSPIKRSININPVINKVIKQLFPRNNKIFPNPFNGEIGIEGEHGIASIRDPGAIYQAFLTTNLGSNICEIGPGLGRSAYFSYLLGARKYTLVDIPIPSLIQGHFLMQVFDRNEIVLNGEEERNEGLHLMVPDTFFNSQEKYDVVVNVDSLTEIGFEVAESYISEISSRSKFFLSINHEGNEFTISELIKNFPNFNKLSRNRSWMRKGYVEELYEIS